MKTKKLSITLILLFVLSGVFLISNRILDNQKNALMSDDAEATGTSEVHSSSEMIVSMNSINDVIKYSTNIIVGTVIEKSEFSDVIDKYVVSVEKNIKGDASAKSIDVYQDNSSLEVGSKYIFLLGYADSSLYPRPIYTSTNDDSIIKVEGNTVIGNSNLLNKMSEYDKFIEYISGASEINTLADNKSNFKVLDKYKDIKEQADNSEHIICIVPKNTQRFNQYVSMSEFNLVEQYKGDINKDTKLFLPAYIQEGKKYIVFLCEGNGGNLELSAREGSVISEEQIDLWNQVIKAIKP